MGRGKQSQGKGSKFGGQSAQGGRVRITCGNCSNGEITVEVAGGVAVRNCKVCDGNGWYMGPAH